MGKPYGNSTLQPYNGSLPFQCRRQLVQLIEVLFEDIE